MAKKSRLDEYEKKLEALELKWIDNKINVDTYNRWHEEFHQEVVLLKQQTAELKRGHDELYYLLKNELHKLTDLEYIYVCMKRLLLHRSKNWFVWSSITGYTTKATSIELLTSWNCSVIIC